MTDQSLDADARVGVRLAVPDDAPDIGRVHVESWRTTYAGIVPQSVLDGLSVDRRAEGWLRRLREPGESRTWVGQIGGRIVGFVGTARPTPADLPATTGEVESIYLLAAAQGRGLGRMLMRAATADLAERGCSSAILWVLTDNQSARRFYEAAGWRADGATKMLDFDGVPIEEMRYAIDLAGLHRA